MEDSVLTKIGYNIIFNNGIFNQVCFEWCKLTRNYQSWIPFKIQLTATDKDPVNHRTLEDTSYHNANNATTDTDITNISTLTEANSLQTNSNQANFTKMFEILEKHGKKILINVMVHEMVVSFPTVDCLAKATIQRIQVLRVETRKLAC